MQILNRQAIRKVYNDDVFTLVPGAVDIIREKFDRSLGYDVLSDYAMNKVVRSHPDRLGSELVSTKRKFLKNALAGDVCRSLIEKYDRDSEFLKKDKHLAFELFKKIISPEVDQELLAYFESEYMPIWYDVQCSMLKDEASVNAFRWHCDAGPSKHIKILLYLNSSHDHQANTLFTDQETTARLKQEGYIYCPIDQRKKDLTEIVKSHNLPHKTESFDYNGGDAVMFSPTELAHRGQVPQGDGKRYMLVICFAPSILPWQESVEKITFPQYSLSDFGACIASYRKGYASIDPRAELSPSIDYVFDRLDAVLQGGCILELSNDLVLRSWEKVGLVLLSIFKDDHEFARRFFKTAVKEVGDAARIADINALLTILRNTFSSSIDWRAPISAQLLQRLTQLSAFENRLKKSVDRYHEKVKTQDYSLNYTDFANELTNSPDNQKFISPSTVVSVIGGYGAPLLTEHLKASGYHWSYANTSVGSISDPVIDNSNQNAAIDSSPKQYGELLSTASIKQLAEQAFEVVPLPRIVYQQAIGEYCDPYRQGITFDTAEGYEQHNAEHAERLKQQFCCSKVLLVCVDINYCWRFCADDSVLVREPQAAVLSHIKPHTLNLNENIDNLCSFASLIRQHNPQCQLIFTLGMSSALSANNVLARDSAEQQAQSDSILRVAVLEAVARLENAHYLPMNEDLSNWLNAVSIADNVVTNADVAGQVFSLLRDRFFVT